MSQKLNELEKELFNFLRKQGNERPSTEERRLSFYLKKHNLTCDVVSLCLEVRGITFSCVGNMPASAASTQRLLELLQNGSIEYVCLIYSPRAQFCYHLKHNHVEVMLIIK